MPKRLVDGDAMWNSNTLKKCPIWARREFPWLLPLADAWGCFELDIPTIHRKVCAIRPDLSEKKVAAILRAYYKHGVLFVWEDAATGKQFAYWIKINHPGRLPPPMEQKKYRPTAPHVPLEKLAAYEAAHRPKSFGFLPTSTNLLDASQSLSEGSGKGLGSGHGSGSGEGSGIGAHSPSRVHGDAERGKIFTGDEERGQQMTMRELKDRVSALVRSLKNPDLEPDERGRLTSARDRVEQEIKKATTR